MTDIKHNVSRRKFLKTSAAAGLGSMISPIDCLATSPPQSQVVPIRPFGNTGVDVPILAFGGSLDTSMSTLLLKQAVKWGVTYWDTA
ncbi:MAG: twin-arginine translocation signal domain-containing protein, partial [Desulfobacterales bacterium]